jgi:hypothetical protein
LRRFLGNARAVLENGLAQLVGIRQYRCVDVDHHLVALARRTRIDAAMQRRLRDQGQRIGLLLLGCTPKVRQRN